jgi:branched-chain amino acid transport system substrate-binding protein
MTIMRSVSAAVLCASFAAAPALAADKVRIGFITDLSSLFADIDGKDGVKAAQMAIDDFGGKVNGLPIELLSADHQNKPDLAVARVGEWINAQNVDMIIGGTNSGVSLATAQVALDKKRVYINVGGSTAALTNEQCSPYTVHYQYDTVALAKGTGKAVVQSGGKSWFFLTADYAFGHALQADTSKVVEGNGGKIVGSVKHPLNVQDLSSFLLQAQSSKAEILALADAGGDAVNAIKTAKEFGVDKEMKIVSLLMFLSDIKSLGLKDAGGLLLTTSWYWDLNDATRAWSKRFEALTGHKPTETQAADYSAVTTYLKAVKAIGTAEPDVVMAELKKTPIDDFFAKGVVRPDGRMVHDMYLVQVKTPAESKEAWDLYKLVATLKGDEIFTTKEESKCALWK